MNRSWLVALLLGSARTRASAQAADISSTLPRADAVRIAEAFRLNNELGDRIWPGLKSTPMPVLLVADSSEFLVGRASPGDEFQFTGDSIGGFPIWSRPRQLSPTILATFPIEGRPTVVIGSAERTGKTSTEWVLTLLHEHFHQWQYTRPDYYGGVARLELSRGDSTGMWMLNYPFPYDSVPVAQVIQRWAAALREALERRRSSSPTLVDVVGSRDALRALLSPADYRYLDFQLWQEGVARYIEYRAAELAAQQGKPGSAFQTLKDVQSYRAAADEARRDLLTELKKIDVRRDRRVGFYPLGAAIALLLDQTSPEWKQTYTDRPFSLAPLLSPD
jgi:hypothetical protein